MWSGVEFGHWSTYLMRAFDYCTHMGKLLWGDGETTLADADANRDVMIVQCEHVLVVVVLLLFFF